MSGRLAFFDMSMDKPTTHPTDVEPLKITEPIEGDSVEASPINMD